MLAALATLIALAPQGTDLARTYKATLDWEEKPVAHRWTCGPDDVRTLASFKLDAGKELSLDLGPSTVVFGCSGTNVLWAALFPEKPAPLRSSLAGDGEAVTSVWLRFHPARVSELFPAATVKGKGSLEKAALGKRMCAWKIRASWHAGDLPVVPKKSFLVVDADTTTSSGAAARRFFTVESGAKNPQYVDAFKDRPLAPLAPITPAAATAAFDKVWEAFDREYAMFGLVPKADWGALKTNLRPAAEKAKTAYEAAAVLCALIAPLEDLHAWVKVGEEFVPGYDRERPMNGNWKAMGAAFPNMKQVRETLRSGKTDDGIAYVAVNGLSDPELPASFDATLEELASCWAMVIDLRFNGGGDETLGQKMAGRFLDKPRVYSKNRYRAGSKHDALGPLLERSFEPRPWRFEGPVIALQGQRTMSSAESMALMLAQCPQVTTMGDRTAGSSGNPRLLELTDGIKVNLPRWIDFDPEGKPIEHVGAPPKVKVDAKPSEFTATSDPVLEAALKRLRGIPPGDRKPAKRT